MIIKDEQVLADMVADGRITEDDAATVRDFGEFLRECSTADGRHRRPATRCPMCLRPRPHTVDDDAECPGWTE